MDGVAVAGDARGVACDEASQPVAEGRRLSRSSRVLGVQGRGDGEVAAQPLQQRRALAVLKPEVLTATLQRLDDELPAGDGDLHQSGVVKRPGRIENRAGEVVAQGGHGLDRP